MYGVPILQHTYIYTDWAIYTQPTHMQEAGGDGLVTIVKGAKRD